MKRVFHPGDEWVFFKLYMGPETADAYITEIMPELINWLDELRIVRKWFFIRYMDPMFHLRLRFQLYNKSDMGLLVEKLSEQSEGFYKNELIWKSEIATYEREIERYGSDWIEVAECLFEIDSRFWLKVLPSIRENDGGEEKRWQSALLSVHHLFADFNVPEPERIETLQKMADYLFEELAGGKKLKRQLDQKFRDKRLLVAEITTEPRGLGILQLEHAFRSRSKSNADIIAARADLLPGNGLAGLSMIHDIIHMSINRGLRSKHRMQEMVIYNFLKRTYVSKLARVAKS